ncbi:MAG: hypothetical protein RR365_14970, partial [Bacteroides sp.]
MNWLKRVKEVAIERNDSMPDKEFFSSKEYSALTQRFAQNMVGGVRSYLARQGYFITPQQEKKLIESTRVNVIYDDSKGAVAAFTDGCNITINAGNELVTKNAHRPTQHYAIQGFRAHEQGHQLFTDFPTIKAWFNELESARWWPAKPNGLSEPDGINLNHQMATDAGYLKIVCQIARFLSNELEDGFIEREMEMMFPGDVCTQLATFNSILWDLTDNLDSALEKKEAQPFPCILTQILMYAKFDNMKLGEYKGEYLALLESCLDVIDDSKYER